MATLNVRTLGDYIRDQRENSQVSLRQLARQAGVSNPYLSQIERGLRKPSAEILQQIAKALRISAEALYVQAGILDARDAEGTVPSAVLVDATINERQKQVLLEIYDSFRKENELKAAPAEVAAVVHDVGDAATEALTAPAKAVKAAVARATTKPAAKPKTAATKAVATKAVATKAVATKPEAKKVSAPRANAPKAPVDTPIVPVNPS